MALLLFDGFDTYNGAGTNTGLGTDWTAANGTPSLTTGRFSVGQSLSISSTGQYRTFTAGASFGIGVAVRVPSLVALTAAGTVRHNVSVYSGSTPHVGIKFEPDGSISAYRYTSPSAGTLLGATAAGILGNNVFQYVEFSGTISDTVGTVVVKVDSVTVLNLSAQDTRNGATTTVDTLVLGVSSAAASVSGGNVNYDDLYVTDGATLGERRIELLVGTADTAQKDFTPDTGAVNYSRVNEAPVVTTNYVAGSTVGNTDRYTMSDLTGTPTTIDALQIVAYAQKTDAVARSIALQVKSGATTSDGSNFALASGFAKLKRLLTTDPNTGIAWTTSGVNAIEVGPKVTV